MSPASPICRRFDQQAEQYERLAGLQRGIAWRLARTIAGLPLPTGPCADLGAGSGLVGQALQQLAPQRRLLQLDGSAGLLARNPLARLSDQGLLWDLESGLPPALQDCALLSSSFALQWLGDPCGQLRQWAQALTSNGWLVLAVPVDGSFPQWHQAAAQAQVPCTALGLPSAAALIEAAAEQLSLQQAKTLRFSRNYGPAGRGFLRQLRQLGASGSAQPSLSAGQWRRLLGHWPQGSVVSWTVLLLVGQRP